MWKKTVLALLLASSYGWAVEAAGRESVRTYNEKELAQLKTDWLAVYQKEIEHAKQLRLKQRANFQQLNYLIENAVLQKNLSASGEQIILRLLATLSGYPLEMEANWMLLNAKIMLKQAKESDIHAFMHKYPNSVYQKTLQQLRFELLYQQQNFEELVEYAKSVKPISLADQCRLLSARYELAASKAEINPEVSKVTEKNTKNTDLLALANEFEQLWFATPKLTSDCANLESYWQDQGFKTDEKVRLKAIELIKQGANAEIANLAANSTDENLKAWLTEVSAIANNPQDLQKFIENQPLEVAARAENKAVILQLFPKYIKTLSEKLENPTFEAYQAWAEKYQLTEAEIKEWKTAFISRLFDNVEPTFQLWRDEQIKTLNVDSLTERRLRMAIWQHSDLNEWLSVLSNDGQSKAEWRYWLAKTEKNEVKRKSIFEKLAQERGFYPMLAAQQLGIAYQFPIIDTPNLTSAELDLYQSEFERIRELRQLERFEQARNIWTYFIKSLSTQSQQLSVIKYASAQNWYDLAVEGTIQIKAFENIDLRLPNAYSDWYDLALADKKISKTFAQAIARQESAWNFQARSHANARGLMQMLPATAEKTAKDNGLPFKGGGDLFRPFNNIMLGTTHLSELNEKYPNNRILIAAAYNAGGGRVEQWLKRANGKLAMDEFIATIPFYETRGYVQNVLAYDYYYQMLYTSDSSTKNGLKMFYKEELEQKY
ncbi:transglycosylase SLT domain-containing protein [Mannheimia granulomatis]|uniref:transglycosylase SLT domain-containing protein n=1 Tax=Mannheimia granulomatis TaxID=85402 RepID=UPI00047E1872|nr:transglycosylase SLT domain-containing protein [Mannheimia granulomatis]QLB19086.1 lytic murein transglycosylase [Mannheimia granulomatis]